MKTLQTRIDLIMIQQNARGSRVLGQYFGYGIQNLHRAVCHVAQIPNGRWYQIQFPCRHKAKIGLRNQSQTHPFSFNNFTIVSPYSNQVAFSWPYIPIESTYSAAQLRLH